MQVSSGKILSIIKDVNCKNCSVVSVISEYVYGTVPSIRIISDSRDNTLLLGGTSPFLFLAPEVPELEKHRCNTRLPANRRYSPVSKTISCSERRAGLLYTLQRKRPFECRCWRLQLWPAAPAAHWLTDNNRSLLTCLRLGVIILPLQKKTCPY